MGKTYLTDEMVEKEIERLQKSEFVKLAKKEERMRFRRRQQLYSLRLYEKKGKELAALGITMETIETMMKEEE